MYRKEMIANGDQKVIQRLKQDGKSVLVYGCANHAELVWNFLTENGIKPEAFIVDSQYYRNEFYINNVKVKDIKEYLERLEQYNIVIGFCDIVKTRFLLENQVLLKSHFYLLWEPLPMYDWDEAYLKENEKDFREIYNSLADLHSKNILKQLIYSKLHVSGQNMLNLADDKQYFNELTYSFDSREEIFVDCGAFTGDTIFKYIVFTGGVFKKIYAFEPNNKNFNQLKENVKNLNNIKLIEQGTWKEKDILKFEEKGSASQIIEERSKVEIPVITIDEVVGDDRVTFIKMDIEGSELESLEGAALTITRNMPKLAICCYHKKNDILDLYKCIKCFDNEDWEYRMYLRHHSNSVYETVLYGIPIKKKR